MPVYPAKQFVLACFGKARTLKVDGQFRVFLQWRYEPDLGWRDTREQAWDAAKRFLQSYPHTNLIHTLDPARNSRSVMGGGA
jgi:hypothetical protein